MSSKINCVVVGGGVIGLSCAKSISSLGIETILLEKNSKIGQETSSRNSEVIHAGIYYQPNSLKLNLCIKGRNILYNYLKERNIPYNNCGKFIVACDSKQQQKLLNIYDNATKNGLRELKIVDGKYVRSVEPEVSCIQAIESPYTGIFDSHTFMMSLFQDCDENNVLTVHQCEVLSIDKNYLATSRYTVETTQGTVDCDNVIIANGLNSIKLAHGVKPLEKMYIPQAYYAKGNYYKLNISNKKVFSRLIYPIPVDGGLGIHSTIDMNGYVRFGPDVEWLKYNGTYEFYDNVPTDYSVDPNRSKQFYNSIREYYPALPDNSLVPDYSGIRAKLCGPIVSNNSSIKSYNIHDFYIQDKKHHGLDGLICLYGMESPGLTSSLAIGEYVGNLLLE